MSPRFSVALAASLALVLVAACAGTSGPPVPSHARRARRARPPVPTPFAVPSQPTAPVPTRHADHR